MALRDVTDPSGPARRLNIGGMPSAPTALLFTAFAMVVLVEAASFYTIGAMREALLGGGFANWLVSATAGLLVLASVVISLPLIRAFIRWRQVHRAVADNDVVAARATRSEARNQAWIAIGYGFAQFIAVLACQFLLANDQAVTKTFFFVPLMTETFPLVLKAFWINVEIFSVTEILVLVWGLVVALAMLAPGSAGRPLRIIAAAYVDVFRAIPAVL